jgi:NADH-quinone oxidoreductase subunit J
MHNSILFFSISFSLLFSSLLVILINNSIYAILLLIVSFVSATGLLLMLECEFMALIFVVIYIGAIAVLFLFVIMMLNIKITNSTKDVLKYFPLSNFIGILFLLEIIFLFNRTFQSNPYTDQIIYNFYVNWYDKIEPLSDLQSIGQLIYVHYVVQFLVAGFVLLISILGAVVLTTTYKQKNNKKQDTFKQVSR